MSTEDKLSRTPLTGVHKEMGARLVEFGGWHMPVQYDGILVEHRRTRTEVSLFDTCHMGRFLVEGRQSVDGLSRLVTAEVRSLGPGRCRYGFLLKEDGGVLDDLITYRLGPEKFLVVVNAGTRAKDFAWLQARLPSEARLTDLSDGLSKIDIQGPRAADVTGALLEEDVRGLPYFGFRTIPYRGTETILSCTGYTGEHGYELYVETPLIQQVWRALMALGARPAGLGARDTLRLEAGLPLYGHELTEELSPVEAGLERYASKAEPFIGQAGMQARRERGLTFRLTGFTTQGRQSARSGNRVWHGGRDVGWVTSGSFAPTLGFSIGMAYLAAELAAPGQALLVDVGRTRLEAVTTPLPFYRRPKPARRPGDDDSG